MEIGKISFLDYTQLALIALLCFGMALYEIRGNFQAVTAIASMLVKMALIPLMALYKLDVYWIAIVALLPLSRLIEIFKRKLNDKLDENSNDSNRRSSS